MSENEINPEQNVIDRNQIARDFLNEVKNREGSPIREIRYPDYIYKAPILLDPNDPDSGVSFYLEQFAKWHASPIVLDNFKDHDQRREWKVNVLNPEAESRYGDKVRNSVSNLVSQTKMSGGSFRDLSQFVDFMDTEFIGEKPQEAIDLLNKINEATDEPISADDELRYDKLADGFVAREEKERLAYISEIDTAIDNLMKYYKVEPTKFEPLSHN